MAEPVTISQYPHGFLAMLASQPFVLGVLISAVVVLFFVVVDPGVTWLINAATHGERRPLIKSKLYMNIAMSFAVLALICTCGAIVVVTVKTANNFDTVSNAYGITISEDPDIMRGPFADMGPDAAGITLSEDHAIMRVLRPGATVGKHVHHVH